MSESALLVMAVTTAIVDRMPPEEYFLKPEPLSASWPGDGYAVIGNPEPKRIVIPMVRFCGIGRDDVYIAYSKELENTIGLPVRMLINERQCYQANANNYRRKLDQILAMTFWDRLKFLFNPKEPT